MHDELDRLEREVEAAMALLPNLSAEPADAALLRVKAAVRHELNEEWLADQSAPLPSAEAVQRVHTAVREELSQSAGTQRLAWGRIASALAAAAMIAISVGVIRQAGLIRQGPQTVTPEVAEAQAHLELFLTAAEKVFTSDTLTGSIYDDLSVIHDDLSVIEEDINGWRGSSGGETGGLGDVLREIDSKVKESPKGVSRTSRPSQGVWG